MPDETCGQLNTERERTARMSSEPHLVKETMVWEEMVVVVAERDRRVESIVKAKRDVLTVGVLMMVVVVRARKVAEVETHKIMEDIRRGMLMDQELTPVANSAQREISASSSLRMHLVMVERDMMAENTVKAKRVGLTVGALLMVVVLRVRRVGGVETHKMWEDIGRCVMMGQEVRVVCMKLMSQRENMIITMIQ